MKSPVVCSLDAVQRRGVKHFLASRVKQFAHLWQVAARTTNNTPYPTAQVLVHKLCKQWHLSNRCGFAPKPHVSVSFSVPPYISYR